MDLHYSRHAHTRMAERGITKADVHAALRRPIGAPRPGQPGTLLIDGFAAGGRILRVCLRADDRMYVVTAYWQ